MSSILDSVLNLPVLLGSPCLQNKDLRRFGKISGKTLARQLETSMSYHISNLGIFGRGIQTDINGYVPTEETGPWDLTYDHSEDTHRDDGALTEYGEWWEGERFPEIKAAAIEATAKANDEAAQWQEGN